MDNTLLKNLISRFNKHAFEKFVVDLFSDNEDREELLQLSEAGDGVYYQEILDSYGGSLHSVFLLHFLPIELFKNIKEDSVLDPELIRRLKNVSGLYKGKKGIGE